MPQTFNVVRCHSCKTFQVQQVKKTDKWTCKLCNEKQSIIKIYRQGTGADCRKVVQELNLMRKETTDKLTGLILTTSQVESAVTSSHVDSLTDGGASIRDHTHLESHNGRGESRWERFMEEPSESESDQEDIVIVNYKRKRKAKSDNSSYKTVPHHYSSGNNTVGSKRFKDSSIARASSPGKATETATVSKWAKYQDIENESSNSDS